MVDSGEGEGEGVASVVELGVVVKDAAGEVLGGNARDVRSAVWPACERMRVGPMLL